jgi:hypothetical protein
LRDHSVPEVNWDFFVRGTQHGYEAFLNVCIAISVAFCWYTCGGTSWNWMSFQCRKSFKALDVSLSIVWNVGVSPVAVSSSYIRVYPLISSVSDLFFIDSACILLLS